MAYGTHGHSFAPEMDTKLDIEKVLKMAIIHDLAEIETGDIPTIHQTKAVTIQKIKDEREAFAGIRSMLGNDIGAELESIWQEFEDQSSAEARFVKAIDKLECVIQKNQQSTDKGSGAPGYFIKLARLCADEPALNTLINR